MAALAGTVMVAGSAAANVPMRYLLLPGTNTAKMPA